ncbi:MAG: hypothetical protein EAZ97_10455 [Bacteroidetes bacterium]|nr:MAG: hypothetical protein EAZ97_10455 [Bacteroidota bacterium]
MSLIFDFLYLLNKTKQKFEIETTFIFYLPNFVFLLDFYSIFCQNCFDLKFVTKYKPKIFCKQR